MTPSILVVGAGIGGLAVSRALAGHGLDCTLVDQREARPGLGMGLNLPGNAMRALSALDVGEALMSHAVPLVRREYRNSRGRLLFAVDEEEFWRGVGTSTCVRHGHLLRALQSPGVRPWGNCVTLARPLPLQVEVLFEGESRPRHYDFVIGADGVRSVVRGGVSPDGVRPSAMTRSSWRLVAANPGVDAWTAWSGADATFLLIPVDDRLVYGYAASTRGGTTGSDPRWLEGAFARFPAAVTQVVSQVLGGEGVLHHGSVDEVRLERWHRGRIVLIGDAAHATGPVWAQGAAMALEDALVLAALLATHDDWDRVGAEFERQRRPRVEHVQHATDRMSRLAALPTWFRDLAAPVLGPRAYRSAYAPLRGDPLVGPAENRDVGFEPLWRREVPGD